MTAAEGSSSSRPPPPAVNLTPINIANVGQLIESVRVSLNTGVRCRFSVYVCGITNEDYGADVPQFIVVEITG